MPTNTKESGLEELIVNSLVQDNGYQQGANEDYNRDYAIDETRLFRFLNNTQKIEMANIKLSFKESGKAYDLVKQKILDILRAEITKRGVIDVLRNGIKLYPSSLTLFYPTPSERNEQAKKDFEQNIWSVTRQLRYSNDKTRRALDFVIFINGLPIFTAELKNRSTKQNVEDAVKQYKVDRNPKELIFHFKRCAAHFAIDDEEIQFCAKLEGNDSWFLPFNKGYNDGAGNPPNPQGLATDYFWKDILKKNELANIIENYAQVIKEKNPQTGKITERQIFPRFHQWAVVKSLLAEVKEEGIGQRYLVQHSAGSGKSNSIAWLAHQLVDLEKDNKLVVDSILVVTDRRNLDRQIRDTIKSFTSVSNTIAPAEHSRDLRDAIEAGKKIIITTIHKFPYIFEDMGTAHKGRRFAIIIDEAHSSQSGNMSAKMNAVLSTTVFSDDDDSEDIINKLIESRKLLPNASYFAFTATPKNKTLELFGTPYTEDGKIKRRPFHNYSMKQAIEEGFILDVLKNYTTYQSYYHLIKTIEEDPLFDKGKARKRLRKYVEVSPEAIFKKAEIIVEHFHENVRFRIDKQARAMVVTGGIKKAVEYFDAISKCLLKRKSPYKAIIAFTGDTEHTDTSTKNKSMVSEADLNRFPSNQIESTFRAEPYRFLICADKFQTGYDEPLLHTMYVDKILDDIKAVQTLSRLNRAYRNKNDTFVLDFANKADDIKEAFSRYYKTTLLSDETDRNKLYEFIANMEKYEVYFQQDIDSVVNYFLNNSPRTKIDPILDICAEHYKSLEEDEQVEFKASAKDFVRLYNFLGAILSYGMPDWEKLSIFLTLLLPKLPAPKENDDTKELLKYIELESYRAQKRETTDILLNDVNYELSPINIADQVSPGEADKDYLSRILDDFHKQWGDLNWQDEDNVKATIKQVQLTVSKDEKYQNAMKNADRESAKDEGKDATERAMQSFMTDSMELYKQYADNLSFRLWLIDFIFNGTYKR
ncbi:MAG: DEAD/DEAH box helicase family protein [Treponema sp.]|jgi:type I restriction enzyme R subunit|nr:DEAD/DEAH box helicase family protein [Treponema sp.]